jgi:hypothetical protein
LYARFEERLAGTSGSPRNSGKGGAADPGGGIASDNSFTVRAMAYIVAGHAAHHVAVLQERYL